MTATILAVGSTNAMADFDIKDISTAGFHVQSQLASGYAATANTDNHFVDSKTGQDVYPIDIEVNDSSETYVATVLVTINEGEVAQLRCKEGEDLSGLGITCGGTYTVKAKLSFAEANALANQRHIEAVLMNKPYTIFVGDVYIKAGEVIASIPLRKIKGKTTKQIHELIVDAIVGADASVATRIQLELTAVAEEAARQAAKQVAKQVADEVSHVLYSGMTHDELAAKVKADCDAVKGKIDVIKGGWSCTGWGQH